MNINLDDIEKLKTFIDNIEQNNIKIDDGSWLDHLKASQAFLVCLGAGPWKIKRRTFIQTQALQILGDRDLVNVDVNETFGFPLEWQRSKIKYIIQYLQHHSWTMDQFIISLKDMTHPVKILYDITHTKNRAKVLDLFVRDYLKLPAFPIDRWVARRLREYNLPQNENYMIELCNIAKLDASYVARAFVSSGNFTGNPIIKL